MFKELIQNWNSKKLGMNAAAIAAILSIPSPDPITIIAKMVTIAAIAIGYGFAQAKIDKARVNQGDGGVMMNPMTTIETMPYITTLGAPTAYADTVDPRSDDDKPEG